MKRNSKLVQTCLEADEDAKVYLETLSFWPQATITKFLDDDGFGLNKLSQERIDC